MQKEQTIIVENSLLRDGFTQIPNYVFSLPISSNAKMAYMALLSYAWTNESCFPGLERLCKDISLSDKPVTRAMRELETNKLIEVKRRGQGKTNLYIIKDFQNRRFSDSRIGGSTKQESANLRISIKEEKNQYKTKKKRQSQDLKYGQPDCPICGGKGWWIDPERDWEQSVCPCVK